MKFEPPLGSDQFCSKSIKVALEIPLNFFSIPEILAKKGKCYLIMRFVDSVNNWMNLYTNGM